MKRGAKSSGRPKPKPPPPVKSGVAFGCLVCPVVGGFYGFEAGTAKLMLRHLSEVHEIQAHRVANEMMKLHLSALSHYRTDKVWIMPDGREVAHKRAIVARDEPW